MFGPSKQTALHIVSIHNYYDLLRYFLRYIDSEQHKQDFLLFQDLYGDNALNLACQNNSTECAELLINKVKSDQRLLSSMILSPNASSQICIDHLICKSDQLDILQLILEMSNDQLY